MAVLSVRNVRKEVHQELRFRAAKAGHSVEAEVRAILERGCRPRRLVPEVQAMVDELLGEAKPTDVVEALIEERRQEALRE